MISEHVKVVKFSELDGVLDRLVIKVLDFFRDPDVLGSMILEAKSNNFLTIPSIYTDRYACCTQGFFCGQNALIFKDKSEIFIVTQLSSLVYGILDVDKRIFYSQERNPGRQDALVRQLISKVDVRSRSDGVFLGIINGYQRPYHYFYDKAPFLCNLDPSIISGSKFLSVRDRAFLPASFFGGSDEVIVDDLSEYIDNREGFAIDVGHPYKFEGKIRVNDFFDEKIENIFRSGCVKNETKKNGAPVIWIGVCQEKRRWVEFHDAIRMLINIIIIDFPNVSFIFDGLTRPEYFDEIDFKNIARVKNDSLAVENVVNSFNGIDYVNLVGRTAKEKLAWAFKTDFFISNALTDSMWCSRFAMKSGVCFSSRSSESEVFRQHRHPVAHIFPFEYVHDLGDEGENWSKMDFSIDPSLFVDFTVSRLKESLVKAR